MRKKEGSLTVEASLVVPLFILCIVTLIGIVVWFQKAEVIQLRLSETARIVSIGGYIKDKNVDAQNENENDDIVLKMPYVMSSTIMIPRVLKPILMQQCVTRKFIGVDKLEDGDEDEIVYMTPNGSVAHKSSGCTYIKSSIISVEGNSIGSRRNTSGGKYYPCRKCVKEEQNMYYVTEYGTRYHADLACSVIARNAYPIKLSVLKKVKMCSKCGSDE